MIETGLDGRVVLITGANSGIGAATAEDIAGIIVFLASDQARWLTGQVVKVSGGHAL